MVLLIIAFIIIILFEVPPLIKKKYWRELIAFSLFLGFGFFLSLLLVLGVDIPSPAKEIEGVIKMIFK